MRATITLTGVSLRQKIIETSLVLTASVFLPFFVHLIPASSLMSPGARLLPMFYAPFIGLFFFSPLTSIVSALAAPYLNFLLTGMPLRGQVLGLTAELFLFTLISYVFLRNNRRAYAQGPCAYLVTQAIMAFCLSQYSASAVKILSALPGLFILSLINIFLIKGIPNEGKGGVS